MTSARALPGMGLCYAAVPRERRANLLYREYLWRAAARPGGADAVRAACREDVLFYINAFGWLMEPRAAGTDSCQPFITYPYQDRLLAEFEDAYFAAVRKKRIEHVFVLKSRDVGASWCALYFFDWLWRFHAGAYLLAISDKENDVDLQQNAATLFGKLDYLDERLPAALRVERGRVKLHITNKDLRSVFEGEASGPNAGRSGRYLGVLRDEEAFQQNGRDISAALGDTTRFQVRISTPNGTDNTFYDAYTRGVGRWVTVHWSEHPEKAAGLYSVEGGVAKPLDKAWHEANPDYPFVLSPTMSDPGTPWEFLRSPWFDNYCRNAETDRQVAQEASLSFLNTSNAYFQPDRLEAVRKANERPPTLAGSLTDFVPSLSGLTDTDMRPNRCRLWTSLDDRNRPPQDTSYSMGVDVSQGTGASDSTINVMDNRTGCKVFEFLSNGVTPYLLAHMAQAVALWFSTPQSMCLVGWDAGGVGQTFWAELSVLNYPHLYYHGDSHLARLRAGRAPGLPQNRALKTACFDQYRQFLFSGEYKTPSDLAYRQAAEFAYTRAGTIAHLPARGEREPRDGSDTLDGHGDIVTGEMVMVMAWKTFRAMARPDLVTPENCYVQRRTERELEQRRWEADGRWRGVYGSRAGA